MNTEIQKMYDFSGKTVVITGGAGILGSEMADALYRCGANIAILDYNLEAAEKVVRSLEENKEGGQALAVKCNVLERDSVKKALETCIEAFGSITGLINGAGGNKPAATTSAEMPFFDLSEDAIKWVFELNMLGTILPSQIFGRHMAEQQEGVILNISSMNAFRPLTKIPAYSAAKAGVSNFTQWLAVHMAQEYSPRIRVNAIAPGFFLTAQNEYLLTDPQTGNLSARGQKIIDHTPMGRFGVPSDLSGTILWLMSPASNFVTGIVVPVDGGFSAFSGV